MFDCFPAVHYEHQGVYCSKLSDELILNTFPYIDGGETPYVWKCIN